VPTLIALKNVLLSLILVALPFSANAEHHGNTPADLAAAIKGFNDTYATNDVETYFGFYAEDATVYFYGERQDIAAYHKEWEALMQAGGGVEKNEMSDLVVQMMPGGDVAIATSFIDNRTRYADGTIVEARAFETDVWQKIDGTWKIISLHFSEIPETTE
jgi:ketosteroid isomerase-like protein